MAHRKVVVFNANDESMVGDVISATRAVFASTHKKQARKVLDYPDDVDIDSADDVLDPPRELGGGDDDSLAEEELGNLKKENHTLDAIFKRLQQSRKKKVTVRAKRASIIPRVTRALPQPKRPAQIPEEDEDSLTWDEEEPFYDSTVNQMEDLDVAADEYEDLDRPKLEDGIMQETIPKKKKSVRLVYVEDQLKKHPAATRSLVRYLLPKRNKARSIRSLSNTSIRKRAHIPITNRITFLSEDDGFPKRLLFPRQNFGSFLQKPNNRARGGRIKRKSWPTNRSSWDEEPSRPWALQKLPLRTDQGDRFQPWLKCVCISNDDATHKHKGRGFTMSGRLHAYD